MDGIRNTSGGADIASYVCDGGHATPGASIDFFWAYSSRMIRARARSILEDSPILAMYRPP